MCICSYKNFFGSLALAIHGRGRGKMRDEGRGKGKRKGGEAGRGVSSPNRKT
jgi:hypothetical protein